jgi:LPXTG-motif cell wall-anchored protein
MISSSFQGGLGRLYLKSVDFNCKGTICYAIGDKRDQQFRDYQRALNLYTTVGKFAPIGVDGQIGAGTVAATRAAAQWLIQTRKAAATAPSSLNPFDPGKSIIDGLKAQASADPWSDAGMALLQRMANPALVKEDVAANIDDFLPVLRNGGKLLALMQSAVGTAQTVVDTVKPVVTAVTGGGSSGSTATTTTPSGAQTTTQQPVITPTDKAPTPTPTPSPTPAATPAATADKDTATGTSWTWYALGGLAAVAVVGGGYLLMRRRSMPAITQRVAPLPAGFGMRRGMRRGRYLGRLY